jgi:hypothetical protein
MTTYSQEYTKEEDYQPTSKPNLVNLFNSSVGFNYSTISGYGLSYGIRFLDGFRVSINTLVHYKQKVRWEDMSKELVSSESSDTDYNFGIELQREILKSNITRLYGLVGTAFRKYENVEYNEGTRKTFFTIGIGVGADWFLSDRISVNGSFGYKFENNEVEIGQIPTREKRTIVGFGFGVLYHF